MGRHRTSKASSPWVEEDDSDSISVTSTRASEDGQEKSYFVERILAEDMDSDQNMFYLIQWEGYPLAESTWEPEENIEEQKTFDDWNEEKDRIAKGLSRPFDLKVFEAQVAQLVKEKNDRRRRRKAKRRRLGIHVSPSESDAEVPLSPADECDSNSSTEAEEVNEEPEDAPGITSPPRRPIPKSKSEYKDATPNHFGRSKVSDPLPKRRAQENQGLSPLEDDGEGNGPTSDDSLVGEILDKVARRKARQAVKLKSDQKWKNRRKSGTTVQGSIGEVCGYAILLMREPELIFFSCCSLRSSLCPYLNPYLLHPE
jgi:Chromo (CHRromatin Organisation MOdifier) domain